MRTLAVTEIDRCVAQFAAVAKNSFGHILLKRGMRKIRVVLGLLLIWFFIIPPAAATQMTSGWHQSTQLSTNGLSVSA